VHKNAFAIGAAALPSGVGMDAVRLHQARLTVDHLRVFLVVAEELSFRRAAERLYLASSPLSRRIKEVEAAFGAVLFERDTRHVRLTPAGEKAIPLVADVLKRFDALSWAVRDENPGCARVVRVGMPYGAHPPDRAMVIDAAKRASGGGDVVTEPGMSRNLARRLLTGELHVSVVHDTIDLKGLATMLLREEEFAVMLSATHPLAAQPRVAISELNGMRFVTVDFHPITLMQVRMSRLLEEAGVVHEMVLVEEAQAMCSLVGSSTSAFALLAAGEGSPYRSFFADPDVVIRPLDDFDLTFKTHVAWVPEHAEQEPLVAAIVDELRRSLAASDFEAAPTGLEARILVQKPVA
jgi:DNA-binding transcriptional LysR family regulator